ncbi:hypothetical protein TIFTF001_028739 [Ficus carica]|uniref:Uncharacterized protein n=1 Tax=Ficus carica TaxID=3494 RepID=A0AA88IWZ9_FICCA|nr:hypothetical protein TIFTF001_028739 [Ficus carica]
MEAMARASSVESTSCVEKNDNNNGDSRDDNRSQLPSLITEKRVKGAKTSSPTTVIDNTIALSPVTL